MSEQVMYTDAAVREITNSKAHKQAKRMTKAQKAFITIAISVAGDHTLAARVAEDLLTMHDVSKNKPKNDKGQTPLPYFTHKYLASLRRNKNNERVQHRNTSREIIKKLFAVGLIIPGVKWYGAMSLEKQINWRQSLLDGENEHPPGFCFQSQHTPFIINWTLVQKHLSGSYHPLTDPMMRMTKQDLADKLKRDTERNNASYHIRDVKRDEKKMIAEVIGSCRQKFNQIDHERKCKSSAEFAAWSERFEKYYTPHVEEAVTAYRAANKDKITRLEARLN